jgi:transaldolase
MKLFIDTIDIERVVPYAHLGIIDGITMNPSSMAKASDPLHIVRSFTQLLPESDICVQVTEQDPAAMYEQAQRLASLAENIVIKIPTLPGYVELVSRLIDLQIRINMTLVCSVNQALILAPLGVSYLSVFVGRLDDAGFKGMEVAEQVQDFLDTYDYDTELLVSSVRSAEHVEQSIAIGADAITMPIDIFENLMVHDMSIEGLETFMRDWKASGKRLL